MKFEQVWNLPPTCPTYCDWDLSDQKFPPPQLWLGQGWPHGKNKPVRPTAKLPLDILEKKVLLAMKSPSVRAAGGCHPESLTVGEGNTEQEQGRQEGTSVDTWILPYLKLAVWALVTSNLFAYTSFSSVSVICHADRQYQAVVRPTHKAQKRNVDPGSATLWLWDLKQVI